MNVLIDAAYYVAKTAYIIIISVLSAALGVGLLVAIALQSTCNWARTQIPLIVTAIAFAALTVLYSLALSHMAGK
jgi:hypothetical protein